MKWLTGTGIFVAALALLWGTAGATFQTAEPHVELMRVLPPDATGVLFVDTAALDKAGFLDGVASGFITDQAAGRIPGEYEEFVAKTGFDPVRDIHQLMVGVSENGPLIVANADFDAFRLEAYFLESGGQSTPVGSYSLIAPDPEGDVRLAFLGDRIVLGPIAAATDALERLAISGPSAATNDSLRAAIAELDVAGNQIWGTGTVGAGGLAVGFEDMAPPMALDLISALERITYEMEFGTEVRARLHGEFSGADTAMRAGDLLRGFVALGKMGSAEEPDLTELLSGFRITNVENGVDVRFTASRELLDRIGNSDLLGLPDVE